MEDKKKSLGKELKDMLRERDKERKIEWNLSNLKIGEFEEELWSSPVKGMGVNIKLKNITKGKGRTVKIFYYGREIGSEAVTFYTDEIEINDIYKDDTLKEKLPPEEVMKHYRKVENPEESVKDFVKGLSDKLAEGIKNAPEIKFSKYSGSETQKTSKLTKGMLDNKLVEHCRSCPAKKYSKSYENVIKMMPIDELEVSINQRANIYRRVLDDFTKEGIPTGQYMSKCEECKREFLGKLRSFIKKKG
jgi:hypothetical protein